MLNQKKQGLYNVKLGLGLEVMRLFVINIIFDIYFYSYIFQLSCFYSK